MTIVEYTYKITYNHNLMVNLRRSENFKNPENLKLIKYETCSGYDDGRYYELGYVL